MTKRIKYSFEHFFIIRHLLKWLMLSIPVAVITGSLVAFFLWALDQVTRIRFEYDWLLFLLPLAGVFIYFLYNLSGKNAEAGNNLIIDEIHVPGGGVPARMAPLVLITTIITHLFGGSAGREGTAVQMGGSIAQWLGRRFKLHKNDIRILLMMGIAAGFGAVFGTPIAGAVFALEVIAIGRIKYDALLPCFMASIFADIVCNAWGIEHTHYHISYVAEAAQTFSFVPFDFMFLLKVVVAAIAFGLVSYMFAELSHGIRAAANKLVPQKWLIPFIGGVIIIGLTFIVGTEDYLGLGVYSEEPDGVSIMNAFTHHDLSRWSWLLKIVFTAITLGMGFKGGEVTPLFFIGATLGNTLAWLLGAPVDLFAALGFIAVFAGATNTPLACTLMGVELFGSEHLFYYAVACFIAYYFSGHTGIYQSQLISVSKHNDITWTKEQSLKEHKRKKHIE